MGGTGIGEKNNRDGRGFHRLPLINLYHVFFTQESQAVSKVRYKAKTDFIQGILVIRIQSPIAQK